MVAWEAPAVAAAVAAAVVAVAVAAGHKTAGCEVAVDAAMAGPVIKATDRR